MCLCTYTIQTPVQSHRQLFHINTTTLNSSKQHKYYSNGGGEGSHKLSLTTTTTKDWRRSGNFDTINGFVVFGAALLAYGVYTHASKSKFIF